MRLSLGVAPCTDPYSGDVIVCPPGTQCDPAGSNTCVGTIGNNPASCPLDVNLTGYTPCECPVGYELDADVNQCVVQGMSATGITSASVGTDASSASSSGLPTTLLLLIGIGFFIFEGGKH